MGIFLDKLCSHKKKLFICFRFFVDWRALWKLYNIECLMPGKTQFNNCVNEKCKYYFIFLVFLYIIFLSHCQTPKVLPILCPFFLVELFLSTRSFQRTLLSKFNFGKLAPLKVCRINYYLVPVFIRSVFFLQ